MSKVILDNKVIDDLIDNFVFDAEIELTTRLLSHISNTTNNHTLSQSRLNYVILAARILELSEYV